MPVTVFDPETSVVSLSRTAQTRRETFRGHSTPTLGLPSVRPGHPPLKQCFQQSKTFSKLQIQEFMVAQASRLCCDAKKTAPGIIPRTVLPTQTFFLERVDVLFVDFSKLSQTDQKGLPDDVPARNFSVAMWASKQIWTRRAEPVRVWHCCQVRSNFSCRGCSNHPRLHNRTLPELLQPVAAHPNYNPPRRLSVPRGLLCCSSSSCEVDRQFHRLLPCGLSRRRR